jgi:hypothetical protein
MLNVRKRRRKQVVENGRGLSKVDTVCLEILFRLLRIPSELHDILARVVRPLRFGGLTTIHPPGRATSLACQPELSRRNPMSGRKFYQDPAFAGCMDTREGGVEILGQLAAPRG